MHYFSQPKVTFLVAEHREKCLKNQYVTHHECTWIPVVSLWPLTATYGERIDINTLFFL